MGLIDQAQRRTGSLARAQPQRGLGMLDREIMLPRPQPQHATQKPATRETRGKGEGAVDQRHHRIDPLAEIGEYEGGVGEDARIVPSHLERLPGEIDALASGILRRVSPALSDEPHVAHRRQGQSRTAVRINCYRSFQQFEGIEEPLSCYRVINRQRTQIQIVGSNVARRTSGRAVDFSSLQCGLDDPGDADRHLVLKFENIFQRAVKTIGPQMSTGVGLYQLRGDAHAVPALAHRAFEDVADPELAPYLLHIDSSSLVSEAGIAGDNKEPADTAEGSDDLLDHAVGKIFLLRIAAQVLERQHRYRRLIGQRQRRSNCRIRGQSHCLFGQIHIEYADRPRDIFDLLLAPVVEGETKLVAHLITHDAADTDSARVRQRLEAGSDIDAIAKDIPPVLDDIAEIDADAKLDPPILRNIGVAQSHLALDVDGAPHRIDDARELDQQTVAGGSDDAPAVFLYLRIGERSAQHAEPFERAFLVLTNEPRVTRNVGRQDGRQPPLDPAFAHRLARLKSKRSRSHFNARQRFLNAGKKPA